MRHAYLHIHQTWCPPRFEEQVGLTQTWQSFSVAHMLVSYSFVTNIYQPQHLHKPFSGSFCKELLFPGQSGIPKLPHLEKAGHIQTQEAPFQHWLDSIRDASPLAHRKTYDFGRTFLTAKNGQNQGMEASRICSCLFFIPAVLQVTTIINNPSESNWLGI